ncbi:hypothetical protein [Devosia submarina]|nr:hypothetical protein [Devosia submarina]
MDERARPRMLFTESMFQFLVALSVLAILALLGWHIYHLLFPHWHSR